MQRPTAPADPRPFLSVIAWPDGDDRAQAVRCLVAALGHGEHDVRMRLSTRLPLVYGQVQPAEAESAMNALRSAGGEAFAPTFADLTAMGPTLRIRDLTIDGNGNLEMDLWQGLGTTIRREDVQILVRAHLSSRGEIDFAELQSRARTVAHRRALSLRLGASGSLGVGMSALAIGSLATEMMSDMRSMRSIITSDKLDIHTRDGSIYQIDGDKFGYRALGELRGHGDKANMDAMFELLAHVAPDEITDDYFALWKAPPGCKRLRLSGVRAEDPAFAFYSRWVGLMYRHLL